MFNEDSLSSDIYIPASASRLLSESSLSQSDADLSLSELSISDRTATYQKPFSLLAPRPPEEHAHKDNSQGEGIEEDDDNEADAEKKERTTARAREDKLRSDIFILKKLNASFASFHEALEETGSANERLAVQLEETEGLLNKYAKMLAKSEEVAKLIFDEEWLGAEADQQQYDREKREAKEKRRRAAEERALATQREAERVEREAQERQQQVEAERLARERSERAPARGGVRGVRGTRASMRASTTAATRGAASTRGVSSTRGSTTQSGSGGTLRRPSTITGRGGIPTRAART